MHIKNFRKRFHLSQEMLASITGIPRDRIAKWEQGKGAPKVADARALDILAKRLYSQGEVIERDKVMIILALVKVAIALLKWREENNMSMNDLAVLTHLPISKLSEVEAGFFLPNDPELKYLWELSGIKLPDVKTAILPNLPISESSTRGKEHILDYIATRRMQKNEVWEYRAAFIPLKAQAGYITAYDQLLFIENMEKYQLPPGVNPLGAIWRYFEVEGDSMEPTIKSSDILLTSFVPFEDWPDTRDFYTYVVVTIDRILVKRLVRYKQNLSKWILISENEELYPQVLIDREDVLELWVVRRLIQNRVPPPKLFELNL